MTGCRQSKHVCLLVTKYQVLCSFLGAHLSTAYHKKLTHLKTDNFSFENVENFNYLGPILNADNKMNIEIAERIAKGNKAYYANAKLIKSKFLKKNTKMKIYKTMIRPVVTYSSETWTLAAKDENNLRIFKRQILRKIFGLVNIDNVWRIRNNVGIDKLIEGANIVRFIKAKESNG